MTEEDRIRVDQLLSFLVRKLEERIRRDALQLAIDAVEYADTKAEAIEHVRKVWAEIGG